MNPNDTPRKPGWYRRIFDRRQKVGVGLFWLGPAALVAFGAVALVATPMGDGIELVPKTAKQVAVKTSDDGDNLSKGASPGQKDEDAKKDGEKGEKGDAKASASDEADEADEAKKAEAS